MNLKNEIKGINFDRRVLILGDIHNVWRETNFLIAKYEPEIILQVGDFGWWPKWHKTTHISHGTCRIDSMTGIKKSVPFNQYGIRTGDTKVYWCPGNHEDWEDLNNRTDTINPNPIELYKNVFYMPRCSTLILPDGRTILFIGGAASTDKEWRRYRYDWYPEETITQADIYNLPSEIDIDIVVSHTSPNYFKQELNNNLNDWRLKDPYWIEKFKDPSCAALDTVWEIYKPKLWFFGHYHLNKHGQYRDTKWFALNKSTQTGWWMFIPEGKK